MAEYICNRNRLDWDGNPGEAVRRGERFAMKDGRIAQALLDEGYIIPVPVESVSDETDDIVPQTRFDGDITDDNAAPQTREFKGVQEHKHDGVNNWHPADREHKNLE